MALVDSRETGDVTRLAFIGFGEAARAFTRSLADVAPLDVTAYDILVHADNSEARALREAAAGLGVRLARKASEAIAEAQLVFSAVTAGASAEALVEPYARPTHAHVLVDINSVTAGRKAVNAALVRQSGAFYVDMAVMAPVFPLGHRTPSLVAGDLEPGLAALRALDFRIEPLGPEVGSAASVKMMRSLFVKGLEALTVQTLSAAAASGCVERVFASLEASYPGLDLAQFAPYQFERMATHGKRRAEEVREVSQAMRDLGFAEGAALAGAIADVQAAMAALKPDCTGGALDCARSTALAMRPAVMPVVTTMNERRA